MSDDTGTKKRPSTDIVGQQIARVYAQALLDATGGGAAEETIVEELKSLVVDVLDRFPRLEHLLGSAMVSESEKVDMLDRVFATSASKTMISFLKVVAKHGRLDCLRTIEAETVDLFNRRRGRIPVELITASELDSSISNEIYEGLRRSLQAEPIVTMHIDPSLIAGFQVRVGDKVFDGSVRTQLDRMRQSMIGAAVDLIQVERDRFVES